MRRGAPREAKATASTRGANGQLPTLPHCSPIIDPEEVAIVQAIRRAYGSPAGYGGLEAFHVADTFDFARRLRESIRDQ